MAFTQKTLTQDEVVEAEREVEQYGVAEAMRRRAERKRAERAGALTAGTFTLVGRFSEDDLVLLRQMAYERGWRFEEAASAPSSYKQRVYNHLAAIGSEMTAEALAQALADIKPATLRASLAGLVSDGRVAVRYEKKTTGRTALYRLA